MKISLTDRQTNRQTLSFVKECVENRDITECWKNTERKFYENRKYRKIAGNRENRENIM